MLRISIYKILALFTLVLSLTWGNQVQAIFLREIESDANMLIIARLGDQTLYARHDSVGTIPQWHPYYAIGAETYLVDAKAETIQKYQTNFFYNQSFSGAYFLGRLKDIYANATEEELMPKVMDLKKKDSGIRMYQAKGQAWNLGGQSLARPLPGNKHRIDVPVSTIYYKGADALYLFIYGVNFDSVMP